jgi:hypothetical protein
MKVVNKQTNQITCCCGIVLEYDESDIKHDRYSIEGYIVCPNCNINLSLHQPTYQEVKNYFKNRYRI